MKPRVVNRRNYNPSAILVDRSTLFGNPFRIGVDGNRVQVVAKHREWVMGEGPDTIHGFSRAKVLTLIPTLKGKNLKCWCYPLPCHASILLELANE